MKVKRIEEIAHTMKPEEFPRDERPDVALVGRSNVGKSSLLNSLVNRKNFARTSSTPGKTRAIYFYLVNNAFYLVDLPGYGYARVSAELRQKWTPMMEKYFRNRPLLALLAHLVDIRHPPTREDLLMAEWMRHFRLNYLVVATKADKVPRGRRAQNLKALRQGLGLHPEHPLITFSAKTKEGREELLKFIKGTLLSVGVKV